MDPDGYSDDLDMPRRKFGKTNASTNDREATSEDELNERDNVVTERERRQSMTAATASLTAATSSTNAATAATAALNAATASRTAVNADLLAPLEKEKRTSARLWRSVDYHKALNRLWKVWARNAMRKIGGVLDIVGLIDEEPYHAAVRAARGGTKASQRGWGE
jgi:hypothetical protein